MTQTTESPGFLRWLLRKPKEIWQLIRDGFAGAGVQLRNWLRRLRHVKLDYIVMPVGGALPERAASRRNFIERQLPFPPAPLSLEQLNRRLQAIVDADNVKGVVFVFNGFSSGLATLQNFRRSLERLREGGKEVVVYTPYLNLPHYYAATAADRIIAPPGAQFDVLGLQVEVTFLKDALQQVGVQMDVVQISPYKTAFDSFQHNDFTPEYREQIEWLLDDQFEMLTGEMAAGRGMEPAVFKVLIDQAPLTAESALAHGLVDALAYEDELPLLLAKQVERSEEEKSDKETAVSELTKTQSPSVQPKAKIRTWPQAAGLLFEKRRRKTRQYIGVISLEGLIVMGPSRRPPIELPIPFLGGAAAGEQTLVRLLRQAEKQDNMAALIFHVDSGGGAALASDLIGREVQRLNLKKPVLVYMGNTAASGGYYVAAAARHIMSQQATITGSIGVITGRPNIQQLNDKLKIRPVRIKRGQNAGLYNDLTPMTEHERQIFWDGIVDSYQKFKQVVSDGRNIPIDALDPICEGRV